MKTESVTHGGKRTAGPGKRIGRNPVPFPVFAKKLRATDEERAEFAKLLTGDARKDFEIILQALKK